MTERYDRKAETASLAVAEARRKARKGNRGHTVNATTPW